MLDSNKHELDLISSNDPIEASRKDSVTPISSSMSATSLNSNSSAEENKKEKDDVDSDDPTTTLMKAMNFKEEGNAFFKDGLLSKAHRSYRRGTNLLQKLNKYNTGDEQVKTLLITLQTNLSMVALKQNKPRQSRDLATKALDVDKTHVKALFRRAVANRKLGELEEAKRDLKEALTHDPDNRVVKRELLAIKKEDGLKKKKEKKAMQAAFTGSLLYQDKVEEEKRKTEEKRRRKSEEADAKKLRKVEWENECVERLKDEKPVVSFEEWEKEQKKRKEEVEKQKKKEKEAQRKKEAAMREKARKEKESKRKDDGSDTDDDILTKSEKSMLRGYKKTSDGRTTSYFNNDLSDRDKSLIGDITPQRLSDVTSPTSTASSPHAMSTAPAKGLSAWNSAQTWEEKDATEWCCRALKKNIIHTKFSRKKFKAHLYGTEIKGEASFATSGGRKRYIFDFNVTTSFQFFIPVSENDDQPDEDSVIAKGDLSLPDVSSTVVGTELYEIYLTWKKSPVHPHKEKILSLQGEFCQAVQSSVENFVREFNSHY